MLILPGACGIGAAIAYGSASAVQHQAVNAGTEKADPGGLIDLIRDPRWLLSIGGDAVGLVLQVIALATGPVVLIQPLLVLALPISLPVGWWLARHSTGVGPGVPPGVLLDVKRGPEAGVRPPGRPDRAGRRTAVAGCLAILFGLAVFLVLVGDPGTGRGLRLRPAVLTIGAALIVTGLGSLAVKGRSAPLRAGVLGALSGSLFGAAGVLVNAADTVYSDRGLAGFTQPRGLIPLIGVLLLGGIGFTLTQVSFQIGALAASFPASESSAPVVAVLLGGLLLHEDIPLSPVRVLVYLLCLAAIVYGTIVLARPQHEPVGV